MHDIEKVINCLTDIEQIMVCRQEICPREELQYWIELQEGVADAIAMLKEQENELIGIKAENSRMFSENIRLNKLLKEQEAVKPYIDIDEAKCPICKVKLTRQELLGDDVLFEDFFDYCPHCGRKVKWE